MALPTWDETKPPNSGPGGEVWKGGQNVRETENMISTRQHLGQGDGDGGWSDYEGFAQRGVALGPSDRGPGVEVVTNAWETIATVNVKVTEASNWLVRAICYVNPVAGATVPRLETRLVWTGVQTWTWDPQNLYVGASGDGYFEYQPVALQMVVPNVPAGTYAVKLEAQAANVLGDISVRDAMVVATPMLTDVMS